MVLDLNKLAQKVTLKEGKKESISVAQVKEVMRLVFIELSHLTILEAVETIKKYSKKNSTE